MTNITSTQKPSRGKNIALWALQIILALQYIVSGIMKLMGEPTMVAMFDDLGAGQAMRYVMGVLEIAGAVAILVPRLAGLAALGLSALAVGGLFTNLFVLTDYPWAPPLVSLVFAVLVAVGRWPQTKALFARRKS